MRSLISIFLVFAFAEASAQEDSRHSIVVHRQLWVGYFGPQSYLVRCSNLSGTYITSGRYPNFLHDPIGHSTAIEDACREMDSEGGIKCLWRIRGQQRDSGETFRFHAASSNKGFRRFEELNVAQVKACAKIHSGF